MSTLPIHNGVIKDGKMFSFMDIDPDDLSPVVREELEQTPASQLDIIYVRRLLHLQANRMQSSLGNLDVFIEKTEKTIAEINKSLKVTVHNGAPHEKNLGDLVVEMYERETVKRDWLILKKLIKKYRKELIAGMVAFILLGILIRFQMFNLFDKLAKHFWDILFGIFSKFI